MGFKKTEKGNVIYEFDFVPTKLVPLKREDCGYDYVYAVLGPDGEKAPVVFEFQGERHSNYALVFGLLNHQDRQRFGKDICICSNVCLVATLAKMWNDYVESYDEADDDFKLTNPADTTILADAGKVFNIMSIQEARDYLGRKNIPADGYKTLKQEMS